MPAPISEAKIKKYRQLRMSGENRSASARQVGVSLSWANEYDRKTGLGRVVARGVKPRDTGALASDAQRAVEDFEFFRRRYFGHVSTPWQVRAASTIVEWLSTDESEFAVMNMPPGSGKSTLLHDVAAWVTCRDRAIRGLYGAHSHRVAKTYLTRLRQSLERTVPVEPSEREERMGMAVPAEATLVEDFGRFRPVERTLEWSAEQFVVEQEGGMTPLNKEPTWAAFGMDSGFLGWRVDLVIWDDLVTDKTNKTVDAREKQRIWWDDVASTRLDPGGLLVLCGQRLMAEDLYRYCLDKRLYDLNGEITDERQYHHIVFPAHDEERCTGDHSKGTDMPAWPESCLLDPKRLSWRRLAAERAKPNFATVYQQEDLDPDAVLVPQEWVSGGTCPRTGEQVPGCWDKERGFMELPDPDTRRFLSIATVDPSPSAWWAVQWWLVDTVSESRFLMDSFNNKLTADRFLDYHPETREYTGLMAEWQDRSAKMGVPIRWWIAEQNAAQRFFWQTTYVRNWIRQNRTSLVPHTTTGKNKSDTDLGIDAMAQVWRMGLVRLPGGGSDHNRVSARAASLKLVNEVTKYPNAARDDMVMAQWFLEANVDRLIRSARSVHDDDGLVILDRPSWLRGGQLV